MERRQLDTHQREHRGVRLVDIAPELCLQSDLTLRDLTLVDRTPEHLTPEISDPQNSLIEDKWSSDTETRFFAVDLPPRPKHPHLRLVEEDADLQPEESDGALSLRSDNDNLSQKRVLFDIMTRVFARNDTVSRILTICQPYLVGETGCHSPDNVSQHASGLRGLAHLDPVDRKADLTPRSTAQQLAPSRACTSHSRPSILRSGGEEMLVTIGVGVLCGMLGLVVGRELTLRSSPGDE